MAELVDAPVLGTGFARSEGSSPFIRILEQNTSCTQSFDDVHGVFFWQYCRSKPVPQVVDVDRFRTYY
jgi:hypothetical protein